MASALHWRQCLIILASSSHLSIISFLSAGVGARKSANFVPSTGIRGRMLTMYAPSAFTFLTRAGMCSSLIPGIMTMLTFTAIPSSAHLLMPSV